MELSVKRQKLERRKGKYHRMDPELKKRGTTSQKKEKQIKRDNLRVRYIF